MGNYDIGTVKFRQSVNDFPLTVALGEKVPVFGLSRWSGNTSLRIIPPADEGFTLRGDKRQFMYNGRRRSHCFTIHGDNSFEYDCILLKEPESNVITLRMEGAENFDFFRQPDFVTDQFLKGSYAVYKKETLLGEGTGKLCHIHRPEIIDARGRRCWGELSIAGNEFCITIPEKWLAEAAYPVIVDPTIGTTTVGSQTLYRDEDNELVQLYCEVSIGVNRFLVSETLNGAATAYVYAYESDYYGRCKPVLYSDNNNVPLARRSTNEGSFDIQIGGGKTAGWRSTNINTNTSIASGSYIWFGLFCDYFAPRFDFGMKCYNDFWDGVGNDIPNTYPVWSANYFHDFKLSMYFTYTSAQNYVRTLTQGVRLTDTRALKADYKRTATQTAMVNSTLSRFETFYRNFIETGRNTMNISRMPTLIRKIAESVKVTFVKQENRNISRQCDDTVKISSEGKGILNIFRIIQDGLQGIDTNSYSIFYLRSLKDTVINNEKNSHIGSFIRELFSNAGGNAETIQKAEYYRNNADTVQAEGNVFKGLLMFVRIITQVFIRDYLLGRFLKAREELVLKSCITREITLDSRLG